MEKTVYDLLDWAGIEELVYSESANPHGLLGPHVTEEGILIQALIPTAKQVSIKLSNGKHYAMEEADPDGSYQGVFVALIPGKTVPKYTYEVVYDNDTVEEFVDPYAFAPAITENDIKKFDAGIHYMIYEKMGAHMMTMQGTSGVYFAVWAPCAMRVSVVGDFNLWDGRRHQMRRLDDSGIFELLFQGLRKAAFISMR